MKKIKVKLKNAILYFTRPHREVRQYLAYEKERQILERLNHRELSARYIGIKATYQYKRNVLSFFVGALLLSALTGIWKFFYNLGIKNVTFMYVKDVDNEVMSKIVLVASFSIFLFIIFFIILSIVFYLRELFHMQKTIYLIEEIRADRDKDGTNDRQ
ncbi:hypothetical protein HCJ58_04970 [Listeria sp. FSL L7-1509]|uniref:Uncharacterized protein n=1 Tax=Listeria immobilis TaxID=2713502 RepID=A0ABR6SUU9_9LIST|nr:hypothetical protein [Listeria immobilis]MBC1506327.1 hypothetical protein [Listeria immobilis]MBC1509392.1 hypothetical protein [Listeria immobilis]MBC6304524.1 hypothetical protein [Listeria immobilis]MBC6312073.1 hypothetical protein [Listeria immobilis]